MRRIVLLLSLLAAVPLAAQTLQIGNDVTPGPPDSGFAAPRTSIDLAHPANATGSITTVKYAWTAAGCLGAVKIKFFRRSGDTFTMTAERGPFDSETLATITLAPPVDVLAGDLIGITRLTDCGVPRASSTASDGFLVFAGDVTGSVVYASALGRAVASLALYGTGTATESRFGVVAVVGSTRGSFDSNWKTALQIHNPSSDGTITGRLVFHPQASIDTPLPSLGYSLGPGQMKGYEDVVQAMGQSGLGSLDVIVPAGVGEPIIAARIYNDAGTSGTAGLTEDLIASGVTLKGVSRILRRGTTGVLFTPLKPGLTRYNIGVRTLDSATTLDVTLRNESGATVRTLTKNDLPNWFEQTDSTSFLGTPLSGNESITITVRFGSAIVYGSTTDNITNDPAVQFAFIVFSTGE